MTDPIRAAEAAIESVLRQLDAAFPREEVDLDAVRTVCNSLRAALPGLREAGEPAGSIVMHAGSGFSVVAWQGGAAPLLGTTVRAAAPSPAPQGERAQPARGGVDLSAVAAFLLGEAPLDGVWFGEKHPTERGTFWWRKYVRGLLGAAPAPQTTEPAPEAGVVEALRRLFNYVNDHGEFDPTDADWSEVLNGAEAALAAQTANLRGTE